MKDGGPAHPIMTFQRNPDDSWERIVVENGMTLLQHYAGLAMQELLNLLLGTSAGMTVHYDAKLKAITGFTAEGIDEMFDVVARLSYQQAQAMIEAGEKLSGEEGGYFIPFGPSGKTPEEFMARLETWGKEKLREGE